MMIETGTLVITDSTIEAYDFKLDGDGSSVREGILEVYDWAIKKLQEYREAIAHGKEIVGVDRDVSRLN